jgi:pSer/pThr/pTyr-binding forkhead associated (FHA) protein
VGITPRETPVAPRPDTVDTAETVRQPERGRGTPAATVTTAQGSVDLQTGSHVIGRLARCEIPVDDPLASRVHAVIRIEEHAARIEDLHSTNGLYVNDRRVVRAAALNSGDRILVGTTELSFFRPVSRPAAPERPVPQALPVAKLTLGRLASSESVPTGRAAVLDLVGALAQRLAIGGNVVEAERALATHLMQIVKAAQSGLVVTEELCDRASDYALALAGWSRKARWTDYVVELHLAARRVMSRKTFASFVKVRERVAEQGDELLVGYYVDSMKERPEPLTNAERVLLFELEALVRG